MPCHRPLTRRLPVNAPAAAAVLSPRSHAVGTETAMLNCDVAEAIERLIDAKLISFHRDSAQSQQQQLDRDRQIELAKQELERALDRMGRAS
jgi:hypothetical protein